ncbi:MAG: PAS domain S-box protein [Desulfobulbus sp.]
MSRNSFSTLFRCSKAPWCIAGLIFILGLLVSWHIGRLSSRQQSLEKHNQAISELAPMRARLEGAVLNIFSATSGIGGVIALRGGISPELFTALTRQAIEAHPYIRNIGVAPNDVITQIYPLESNREAIGLRYAENHVQYGDVRQARLTGRQIFSGPHQLVQGGMGLIARVPVFTRTASDPEEPARYWGNVSVVTYVASLLDAAGVRSSEDFHIGLRKIDPRNADNTAILRGDPALFSVPDPVVMPVDIPGAQWQLLALPREGWPVITAVRSPLLYIGLVHTLLLSCFVWWLAARPEEAEQHNLKLQKEIHERTLVERNLRLSEQKYASFFHLIPDMGGITRFEDSCFLEINSGFTRVSGWRPKEVIGRTSIELGLWTIEERQQAISLLQEHGRLENFPFLLRTKSGEQRHALMFLTRIHLHGTECLFFMARDINELKMAQLRLEQEQAQLRNLLQTVPALIWMKDPQGIYLSCNNRFQRFAGLPEAEIIGRTDFELFDREQAEGFRADDQKTVNNGSPTISEEWITYADDGHRELLETIKTPLHDAGGTLQGVLGIGWDITEKKRIEKELLQERTRFINLVDSVDGIVWETDARTLIFTYISREAQRLLGYPIEDWSGERFWLLHLHPEDREWVYTATMDATARGEDHELSYRFLAADGRTVWIQDRITVVPENGHPRWRRGIMVDTTQEKEAEHRRILLENQLRQAQKIEAVGRLAGGVAHDFNNQLSVILGYADLMQQSDLSEEKRRSYTNQIIRAASQSRDITRQLLAFSRREVISPQILDLNLLVKGIKKGLGRLIREDILFEVHTAPGLWPVYMDSTQVDQILMNLIVNARDAMAGHGQVTIETANISLDASFTDQYADFAPGDYVQLSVRDTGIGMSRETLPHIFEPFYTTKETGKGTGLGLSTVYGIVTQNKGQVLVESKPGAGTTFKVFLPRCHVPLHEETMQPAASVLQRRSGTILLVEDEKTVRQMARDMLEAGGHVVLVAIGPAEALRIAGDRQNHIDLLLTDVIMPEMNGNELWKKIHALRPEIQPVFMSGYTGDILQQENGYQVPFIKKPFTMRSLLETIEEQLRNFDKTSHN